VDEERNISRYSKAIRGLCTVCAKYGRCCIIFDGYRQGPSIKDHEHEKRIGLMVTFFSQLEFLVVDNQESELDHFS